MPYWKPECKTVHLTNADMKLIIRALSWYRSTPTCVQKNEYETVDALIQSVFSEFKRPASETEQGAYVEQPTEKPADKPIEISLCIDTDEIARIVISAQSK